MEQSKTGQSRGKREENADKYAKAARTEGEKENNPAYKALSTQIDQISWHCGWKTEIDANATGLVPYRIYFLYAKYKKMNFEIRILKIEILDYLLHGTLFAQ